MTTVAKDSLAFGVQCLFIIRLLDEACSIHLRGVALVLGGRRFEKLAFFAGLDTFEVITNLERERKCFGVVVSRAAHDTTEKAICLDRCSIATCNTLRTVPVALDIRVGVEWRIETGMVEGIWTAVTTKDLAVASTSTAIVIVLLSATVRNDPWMCTSISSRLAGPNGTTTPIRLLLFGMMKKTSKTQKQRAPRIWPGIEPGWNQKAPEGKRGRNRDVLPDRCHLRRYPLPDL